MENLGKVYELNKSIDVLRKKLLHLMYNESDRTLDNDPIVLIRVNKIQKKYRKLTHERNKEIQQAYAHTVVRIKPTSKIESVAVLFTLPKLQMTSMTIGKNSTQLNMTPKWFNLDDEEKALKTIKYPRNVVKKRSFDTIARFRTARNEKTDGNDFIHQPIEIKTNATETLILALDAFVQQFDGKLSFTNDDLSFENSAHRTACGVADLGSAHLLSNEHILSANFALIIELDYDDLARSQDTMSQFLLTFVDAVANDLQCDNDYVRVSSVEKSRKVRGKAEVNLVLTTPEQSKTEELVETFKDHARKGFANDTVLQYIRRDEYQCKWKPVLSFLQLQPLDFDPKYNFDYEPEDTPEQLQRGGLPYYLPKGWYRHALKVDNKYKDGQIWLGSSNADGEWPVAFHGTKSLAVKGITDKGLLTSSVVRDRMLKEAIEQKGEAVNRAGLYVATHCNGGSHPFYTEKFEVPKSNGKTESFQVVFQCRVRPNSYTTHTTPVKIGQAWRVVDPKDVRPYGVLLKNTTVKVPFEEDDD